MRPSALIFGMLVCSMSLCGPLPSLFKLFVCSNPLGEKWPGPGGHMFCKGLYREKHEKIFLSKSQDLES